jgi:HSP20 family protein
MARLGSWQRPAASFARLRRDLEQLLDDFGMPRAFRREVERLFVETRASQSLARRIARVLRRPFVTRPPFSPAVEMIECDDAYVVRVDLPGVREQDIQLSVDDDDVLTISGERRREETKRERAWQYAERGYGSFTRSMSLPRTVDPSKIAASFANGVLDVRVPKSEAAAHAHPIPIHAERAPSRDTNGSRRVAAAR